MPKKIRSQRAEGIILKHRNWGEADRMLAIYTRELGKIQALAKGVRKPRSRKAGHIEPFTCTSLLLARGRNFYILTQAETILPYLKLRQDLVLLGYASYLVELLDRFTYDDDENPTIYHLLKTALTQLEQGGDAPQKAIHYYEIRLLDQMGFRPQLFNCVNCDTPIQPQDQFFSAHQGGALCPRCGSAAPEARPVSMQALKYLRHYQRSSYADAARVHFGAAIETEVERLMGYYLTYLLERGLNTPGFLRRVQPRHPE